MRVVISTSHRDGKILNAWIWQLLTEGVNRILILDRLSNDSTRVICNNWYRGTNGKVLCVDEQSDCLDGVEDDPSVRDPWIDEDALRRGKLMARMEWEASLWE